MAIAADVSQYVADSMSWGIFLQAIVGLGLLRYLLVYSYRLTIHPLALFPGPALAKVSHWYGAYQSFHMQLHIATYEGHQKYGSVYRQAPNKLIFNTVSALQSIYCERNFQKSKGYLVMQPAPGVYNIHTAIDKNLHRFKRKFIGQGLSDANMRAFEPEMLKHIDLFVKLLSLAADGKDSTSIDANPPDSGPSKDTAEAVPVNLTNRCKHLGFDIMGQFGFGSTFNLQTSPLNRFLVTAIAATNHRHHTCSQYPLLARLGLERIIYRKILRLRALYANLTTEMVTARLQKGKHAQPDLFAFIANARDPETGRTFTEREMWSETRFLLVAGGDTTSTALAATFFYLSRNPRCYARVAEEVRATFASGAEIKGSGPQMARCVYLRACIDEAMRMSPPASGTLWREVRNADPLEGTYIDGNYVPEGTDVGVNIYSVHHNEEYFPQSFVYRPERWMMEDEVDEEEERERLRVMRQAFVPFSLGSRGCAGKTMAYMEASVAMAKTLWYLDFERPARDVRLDRVGAGWDGKDGRKMVSGRGREDEFQLYEHLTTEHDGPWLVFRHRNDLWRELL